MDTKENKIKFLVFSAAYPYRGGISDSTHSLCNELIRSGVIVEVWTFSLLYPSFLFPGRSQYSNVRYKQNFKIKRLINTLNPLNWLKVSKMVNNIVPDSLIFRYWSPILSLPYFFIRFFLKKKIKIIGLVDNWDNHEKVPFENLLRKLFLISCDTFISMSENVGKQIKQSTSKKVIPLFHPINLNLPKPVNKKTAKSSLGLDDTKYISFIGLIRKYKGLKTLIKSIEFLRDTNIKLIIAGEFYEPVEHFLKIIDELKLNDKIIINNKFLDPEKIRDYMCASDLIIQPYLKASQSGITPLCYFYETPSVVSNVSGLKEVIIRDGSGAIFNKTPEDLSNVILESLEFDTYNNLKSNIRKSKKKYNWSSFIKKLNNI